MRQGDLIIFRHGWYGDDPLIGLVLGFDFQREKTCIHVVSANERIWLYNEDIALITEDTDKKCP